MEFMNDFFFVIKGYVSSEENRDIFLLFDIIYKIIDDLI